MPFFRFPLADDEDTVIARVLDDLRVALPGWRPVEGTLDTALAEEIGRELAVLGILTADVSDAVVTKLGVTVFNVPTLPGAYATQTVRFTLTRAGATVPAGFIVIGTTDDGATAYLATLADAVAAAGSLTVDATVRAVVIGVGANDVPTGPLTLANASDVVLTAAATTVSSGGVDPESDTAYRDRFTATMSTLTRTPVLPADFAVRARDVEGVARALALDGYDPAGNGGAGSSGNERLLTVVPVDVDGLPVPAATRTAVVNLLDGLREVNFVVKATTPSYTTLTVTFAAVADAGADPATVRAAVIARALQLLSPGTWGGGDQQPSTWTPTPLVRRNYLLAQLGAVDGVAYLTSLTLNGAEADVSLAGVAGLPAPSTSSGAAAVGVTATTVTGTVVSG